MPQRADIGLFWVSETNRVIETAVKAYLGHPRIACVTLSACPGAEELPRRTASYPYDAVNALVDVFNFASERGIAMALVSFGNGVPVRPSRLLAHLDSERVRSVMFSFRIGRVVGRGFRHSPRLPFVDDHFIVMNVELAQRKRFFSRRLIQASHFASIGGRHAVLLSMIEYSLEPGEFHNHFEDKLIHDKFDAPTPLMPRPFFEDSIRDQYGRRAWLAPRPYLVDEDTGYVTCYPEFDGRLLSLLEMNLVQPSTGADKYVYIRPSLRDKVLRSVKALKVKTGDLEFRKDWSKG